MTEHAKHLRKLLLELSEVAHEREREQLLAVLADHFDDWRNGRMSTRELDAAIDRYHTEYSKELHRRYHTLNVDILVAQAAARNILHEEEIPEELKAHVHEGVKLFRSLPEDEWTPHIE